MVIPWVDKRILVTVRTYPIPAEKGIEVSCTAGIAEGNEWIRLFPVPYRFMDMDKRFRKYQWINVSVKKSSSDARPESYKLNIDSIPIGDSVSPVNQWAERKKLIFPLKRSSLCEIKREQQRDGFPTLAIFKPAEIKRLWMEPCAPDWTVEERQLLSRQLLFAKNTPHQTLEKIPYEFRYEFHCAEEECTGHKLMCTDWEMGQSYRLWNRKYGANWESRFRQRYEEEMINKYETYFYVGTVHGHPDSWIIIGLFYPPKVIQ
jgi:hypothetical protein